MTIHQFRLYITPRTTNSLRAINNLDALCQEDLEGQCEIEIIDVTQQPSLAERDRILATPTLVRSAPEPVKRIIGDLSDRQKLRTSLDLLAVGAVKMRLKAN
jgi:circadian clock protein KaiB